MNYSKIDTMSIVDGDGCRVTLFVSGCRNHCKGCFNEATWDFAYGNPFTDIELNEIIEACKQTYIDGITCLGGEPMEPENQPEILKVIDRFKQAYPQKTIWLYTGYVLERDLLSGQRKFVPVVTDRILDNVDVLVDGPFILEKRDLTLKFRGSSNQRLLDRNAIRQLRNKTV